VSPEDAGDIGDLKTYTRDLMTRMEADLGTKLDWVAVDHWNTDNPHTHIVLRGRQQDGSDLVIARDYIANGMRNRARELATEWLGPRTEMEIRDGMLREVEQERWTGLDRMIQREAKAGVVNLVSEPADAQARFRRTAMIGRLQKLTDMGLADHNGDCVWTLHADAETTLRQMSERGDIIRTMQRAMTGLKRDFVVLDGASAHTPVVGRIVDKGLADELYDRGYLIVDGVDGRAHYVPLAAGADFDALPIGGIVETRAATERTADRTIAGLASNGVYRTDHHLAVERAKAAPEHDPDSFVAAHVRRLEALRRAGIVERVEDGVWRVPADLAERGKAYDARRLGGVDVELRSHLPIDRQTRAIGATWLDRQRFGDLSGLGQSGFGAEVRDAMRNREDYLVDQGLAERRGQRVVFARNLLATLRSREIDAAAKKIAGETGLQHHVVQDGERISGIYRRSVMLASGRFAMLDDGLGFSLVPWRPVLEKHLGQSVAGVARGNSVSWMFGRNKGLGI
jgi:type IV secretory pathway VirD2 relaxase